MTTYHTTIEIKKKLVSILKRQLSYNIRRGLKKNAFARPSGSFLNQKDLASKKAVVKKGGFQPVRSRKRSISALSSSEQSFLEYMLEASSQFKKLFQRVLEFGKACTCKLVATQAIKLFVQVVQATETSNGRHNLDTALVCVLYFASKKTGMLFVEFRQALKRTSSMDKYQRLSLKQMKSWKAFSLVQQQSLGDF